MEAHLKTNDRAKSIDVIWCFEFNASQNNLMFDSVGILFCL